VIDSGVAADAHLGGRWDSLLRLEAARGSGANQRYARNGENVAAKSRG
jgi:hypothetical protein